ncbi:hypothetical protein N7463_006766 [Penicillium fimorum]|uniref:Protein kinase domain-containing protein n=1 Tax=Penicillium fimorum TaxID=1882269 RepID=A0A9W9XV30_9EURO|nr:hypothetical protein N7463_006766 [Penicillium fimorum]
MDVALDYTTSQPIARRGIVPRVYGAIKNLDPKLHEPHLDMFSKDEYPPKAIFLEYIPDMKMMRWSRFTKKRIENFRKGLQEIHQASVLRGDVHPRNMIVVEGDPEWAIWIDFDRVQLFNSPDLNKRQKRWIQNEKDVVHEMCGCVDIWPKYDVYRKLMVLVNVVIAWEKNVEINYLGPIVVKKDRKDVAVLESKLDRMVAMLAASEKDPKERAESGPARSSSTLEENTAAPDETEGKLFMEVFSKKMFPLFPFLMIPPNVTAEELHREKPFLYLNISMVACQNARRQREIVDMVQSYVAEHIVIRGENNLDLLQGLLVNVTWFISVSRLPRHSSCGQFPDAPKPDESYHHVVRNTAQLDTFVHLLVAQSYSLGLGRELTCQKNLNYPLTYLKEATNEDDQNPVRTLEERRTYLGCYYLTTMLSTCVKDLGPIIQFTRYTDECCNVLDQVAEYPSDAYLVQLVRVMNLADRIHHTLYNNELHSLSVSSASPPLGLSIRWFEAELKQLKDSMPSESPHSGILQLHYSTLEIHLYRIALNNEPSKSNYGDHPLMRLDLLFRCLEATTSFVQTTISLPSSLFPFLPFSITGQFGKAIITLSQLSLYDHPGWDRAYVESIVDFDQTIDRIASKLQGELPSFEQAAKDSKATGLPEIFGRMANRAKMLKNMHRGRKEALEQNSLPANMLPIDFDFMMNYPLDLMFPFGETPPVYGEYSR